VERENRVIVAVQTSTPGELRAAEALVVQPPEPPVTQPPAALAAQSPEDLAVEVSRVLDVIASRMQLQTPHPSTASHVRGGRTVPRDFVLSLLAAAERRPDDLLLQRFDTAAAREVLESTEAYRLVAERVALFLASVKYTIEARWADVAANAVNTFKVASIMAGDPNQAELAAEVENLRPKLGRKGPGKKKITKK
jgi:hypothetical protein